MKKLFIVLAAVGMIFTACGPVDDGTENENGNGNGNQTEQPGDNQGGGNSGDNNNDDDTQAHKTPLDDLTCAPNEILYTTKYGLIIELGNTQGFGGNLVYNT